MVRVVFKEVSVTGYRKYRDGEGKLRTQQKKFYQTLSPFNKNFRGQVKNRQEILVDLQEEIKKWMEDSE